MKTQIDLNKIKACTLINFYNAVKANKDHCQADLKKIKKHLTKKHPWTAKYLN